MDSGKVFVITLIGFTSGYLTAPLTHGSDIEIEVYEIVTQCESTLPRNQTCKYIITAVPEVKE